MILFYENLTDFLVTNLKIESGENGEEVETYNCVYSANKKSAFTWTGVSGPSLTNRRFCAGINFILRFAPEETGDRVTYQPLALDKEQDDNFVASLEYLGGNFTFEKSQFRIFFNTLNDKLQLNLDAEEDMEEVSMRV